MMSLFFNVFIPFVFAFAFYILLFEDGPQQFPLNQESNAPDCSKIDLKAFNIDNNRLKFLIRVERPFLEFPEETAPYLIKLITLGSGSTFSFYQNNFNNFDFDEDYDDKNKDSFHFSFDVIQTVSGNISTILYCHNSMISEIYMNHIDKIEYDVPGMSKMEIVPYSMTVNLFPFLNIYRISNFSIFNNKIIYHTSVVSEFSDVNTGYNGDTNTNYEIISDSRKVDFFCALGLENSQQFTSDNISEVKLINNTNQDILENIIYENSVYFISICEEIDNDSALLLSTIILPIISILDFNEYNRIYIIGKNISKMSFFSEKTIRSLKKITDDVDFYDMNRRNSFRNGYFLSPSLSLSSIKYEDLLLQLAKMKNQKEENATELNLFWNSNLVNTLQKLYISKKKINIQILTDSKLIISQYPNIHFYFLDTNNLCLSGVASTIYSAKYFIIFNKKSIPLCIFLNSNATVVLNGFDDEVNQAIHDFLPCNTISLKEINDEKLSQLLELIK